MVNLPLLSFRVKPVVAAHPGMNPLFFAKGCKVSSFYLNVSGWRTGIGNAASDKHILILSIFLL
jgi:hypothetical protein